MKDKIAFENSVREKSKALIQARKKRQKAVLYTASSLCTCFIIAFGVFLSAPMISEKAFVDSAPESAGDFFYSEDADYSNGKGSQNASTGKEAYDRLPTYTQAQPSQPENPSVTEEPSVPTTTGDSHEPSIPVTTSPQIYPEQDKSSADYLKRYALSASVYSSEIAKLTKSSDEINLIIDLIFANEEIKTEPDGEYSVKVVIRTPSDELVFFLTESDVADIIP